MTRVSTFGTHQVLLLDMLKNQQQISESQKQVTSGNKSRTFDGIAPDVATLMSAKSVAKRTDSYLQSNKELQRIMEIQNLSMQGLVDVADRLRERVLSAVNSGSGIGLRPEIDSLFDTSVNLLNSQENGRYIFAGTRNDTAPISATTPAALEALGLGNEINAFTNNNTKLKANIDDNQTLTYGVTASEIGQDLYKIMQDLMIFESANSFDNPLTLTQKSYLIGKVAELNTAFNTLNVAQAKHGALMNTLQELQDRHTSQKTFIRTFIADIEDTDIAAAITRLNRDQLALDAAYQIFSKLNRSTLLNFL